MCLDEAKIAKKRIATFAVLPSQQSFLSRGRWPKGSVGIMKHNLCTLEGNEHIGMTSMGKIDEAQRHWDKVSSRSIDPRSHIDFCLGRITTRELDDFNLPTLIEGNKVAGYRSRFMPNKCVSLKCAWTSIMHII